MKTVLAVGDNVRTEVHTVRFRLIGDGRGIGPTAVLEMGKQHAALVAAPPDRQTFAIVVFADSGIAVVAGLAFG